MSGFRSRSRNKKPCVGYSGADPVSQAAMVVATFCVCALSLAGAIFPILELDHPFEGFVQVSSAPLRSAIAQLGQ